MGKNAELLNVATKNINSYNWATSSKFSHNLNHVQMHLKDDRNTLDDFKRLPFSICLSTRSLCVYVRGLYSKCSQSFLHPLCFVCLVYLRGNVQSKKHQVSINDEIWRSCSDSYGKFLLLYFLQPSFSPQSLESILASNTNSSIPDHL